MNAEKDFETWWAEQLKKVTEAGSFIPAEDFLKILYRNAWKAAAAFYTKKPPAGEVGGTWLAFTPFKRGITYRFGSGMAILGEKRKKVAFGLALVSYDERGCLNQVAILPSEPTRLTDEKDWENAEFYFN